VSILPEMIVGLGVGLALFGILKFLAFWLRRSRAAVYLWPAGMVAWGWLCLWLQSSVFPTGRIASRAVRAILFLGTVTNLPFLGPADFVLRSLAGFSPWLIVPATSVVGWAAWYGIVRIVEWRVRANKPDALSLIPR
jgi:hypothetical protein